MRVDVVVLNDALDVDVVDVTVLAVRTLSAFRIHFCLVSDHLRRISHALRILHLLLIHHFLVVGRRQHSLVEHLRVLQLVLQQHLVDLC